MICHEIKDLTVSYLELDLTPELVAAVTAHLEHCPACRAETEAVRQVLVRLKGRAVPEPGERFWKDFSAGVKQRLAHEHVHRVSPPPLRRWKAWRPAWSLAVAASVLILIGGWLLGGGVHSLGPLLAGSSSPILVDAPGSAPAVPPPQEPAAASTDLGAEEWPGDWDDDPDSILAEMASHLDQRAVDQLFEDI